MGTERLPSKLAWSCLLTELANKPLNSLKEFQDEILHLQIDEVSVSEIIKFITEITVEAITTSSVGVPLNNTFPRLSTVRREELSISIYEQLRASQKLDVI